MKGVQFGHFFCVALFILGLGSNTYAHKTTGLTIFVDSSYPPYMYKTEGTSADGLYPRLLKELIRQSNNKADIKAYPWKRALLFSEAGKGAVGGAYKNDERIKTYDFSNPLYEEKLVLFVNKNKSFDYNSIEDLKGKVIGVNRGWSYGQAFDEARNNGLFTVHVSNDPTDNFKMLALGRIDSVILEQTSGDFYTQLLEIEDNIMSLPVAFSLNSGYLIIPKTLHMTTFISEINEALEKIKKDGTYNEIVKAFTHGIVKPLQDEDSNTP